MSMKSSITISLVYIARSYSKIIYWKSYKRNRITRNTSKIPYDRNTQMKTSNKLYLGSYEVILIDNPNKNQETRISVKSVIQSK